MGAVLIIVKIFNKIVDIMAALGALLLVLTTLIIAYTIFVRLFGFVGLRWGWQFAEHAMFWFPFLAAPWLLRNHRHVSVDLVLNSLPEKVKKYLYVLHGIMGIFLCVVLAYFCTSVVHNNYVRGIMEIQVVDLPKWILFLIMPVAFTVLSLQFVQNLVISIKNLKKP